MACNGHCNAACCAFPFAVGSSVQLGQFTLPEWPIPPGGWNPQIGPPACPEGQWAPAPGQPCLPLSAYDPQTAPPACPEGQWAPAPGMPCLPSGGALPGGGGQLPPAPQLPGMVTEAQCQAREQAARSAEEAKAIKYAAIGAVVSGVIGYGLARVLG